MHWPQYVMMCLLSLGTGLNLSKDLHSKDPFYEMVGTIGGVLILCWLLIEGGFFS